MARKELSPYAPDRWIRELNRRYPSLWADLRKGYADPVRMLRPGSGGVELLASIPDWCIMPTLFPFLVMTDRYGESFYLTHMDELMTMGTTYTWRCSKGVYRFAPEIYDALIRQPLTGNLPQECLYRMPEWAVYIETPGLSYERMNRCFGSAFSFARLEFHARTFKKPNMSIWSISCMRHPASSREL